MQLIIVSVALVVIGLALIANRRKLTILPELLRFMLTEKRWWLTPIIIVIVILALLMIIAQGSVLGPFIYVLF